MSFTQKSATDEDAYQTGGGEIAKAILKNSWSGNLSLKYYGY